MYTIVDVLQTESLHTMRAAIQDAYREMLRDARNVSNLERRYTLSDNRDTTDVNRAIARVISGENVRDVQREMAGSHDLSTLRRIESLQNRVRYYSDQAAESAARYTALCRAYAVAVNNECRALGVPFRTADGLDDTERAEFDAQRAARRVPESIRAYVAWWNRRQANNVTPAERRDCTMQDVVAAFVGSDMPLSIDDVAAVFALEGWL